MVSLESVWGTCNGGHQQGAGADTLCGLEAADGLGISLAHVMHVRDVIHAACMLMWHGEEQGSKPHLHKCPATCMDWVGWV